MRELRLWESEEGLAQTFDDVGAAAARCRFGDCSHEPEPGCGVRAALDDGTLATTATTAGGSSRTSCAGWRSSRTPAPLRGEEGDQEAGPRSAEGLLVNQRRRGWVFFHSERDGSRPASRARLTHSVWAWRRTEWSPSGKSSTWSLIEASRRPQSGHV